MKEPSLDETLQNLLGEEVASARLREHTMFDSLAGGSGERLVLFGAGNLGKRTLLGLRNLGIEPLAFTDNNAGLWGKEIFGLKVLPPEEAAKEYGENAVILVTIWCGEGTDRMGTRIAQFRDLGCARVIPFGFLYWKHPEVFLPHYSLDLPHRVLESSEVIRDVWPLWSDEYSKKEFLAQLRWRLFLDFECLPPPVQQTIYFPEDLVNLTSEEVLVDCGAFDGDTIRSFMETTAGRFGRVVALEPDPGNYRDLSAYRDTLTPEVAEKLDLIQTAAGLRREKVRFNATGTAASALGSGELEVDCAPLDEIVKEVRPTFIKMDVEGAEPDVLGGARGLVGKHSPILAVCVYHRQAHLWEIPGLIRAMNSGYRFFLRPHLLETWDLVCYALPAARTKN